MLQIQSHLFSHGVQTNRAEYKIDGLNHLPMHQFLLGMCYAKIRLAYANALANDPLSIYNPQNRQNIDFCNKILFEIHTLQ